MRRFLPFAPGTGGTPPAAAARASAGSSWLCAGTGLYELREKPFTEGFGVPLSRVPSCPFSIPFRSLVRKAQRLLGFWFSGRASREPQGPGGFRVSRPRLPLLFSPWALEFGAYWWRLLAQQRPGWCPGKATLGAPIAEPPS